MNIKKTIAIIGVSLLVPVVAFAQWTSAPANPPSNNVAAPINVSGSNQAKTGGLEVASFLSDGGAVVMGNLGVGLAPAYKLDVSGDANALRLCIGGDCRNAWPSGGGGGISSFTINTTGGITGGGTINATGGSLTLDTTSLQLKLTGSCSGNQFVQSVGLNGALNCATAAGGSSGTTKVYNGVTSVTVTPQSAISKLLITANAQAAGWFTYDYGAAYYGPDICEIYLLKDGVQMQKLASYVNTRNDNKIYDNGVLRTEGVSFSFSGGVATVDVPNNTSSHTYSVKTVVGWRGTACDIYDSKAPPSGNPWAPPILPSPNASITVTEIP